MVGDRDGNDAPSGGDEQLDGIGQIVFALRVVGTDALHDVTQRRLVEGVDAGVHLVDRELLGRAVFGLDDAFHRRRRAGGAQHAPEARRQRHARRHHRERRARIGVDRGLDVGEDRGVDERHVAVRDDERAAARLERVERDAHRVARAELLCLHDGAHGEGRQQRFQLGIRDDRHVVDIGAAQRFENPPQHRPPAQLVQHLRARRLHSRPLAGGEDDRAGAHAAPSAGIAPPSCGGSARSHSFCSFALTPPSASIATRKRSRTMSRPSSSIESKSGSAVGLPLIAM